MRLEQIHELYYDELISKQHQQNWWKVKKIVTI